MPWAGRQRLAVSMALALSGVLMACASPPPTTPGGGAGGAEASGGSGGGSAPPKGGKGGEPGKGGAGGGEAPATPDAAVAPPAPDAAPASGDTGAPPSGEDASGPPIDPNANAAGDQVPDRPLNVDKASPQVYRIQFKPTDADPASTGRNESQTAIVDTTKTLRKKLVIVLSGSNGSPGPIGVATFAADLGFHAYAMAYHNEFNASQGTGGNPEICTNSRFNELDGMGRTPTLVKVPRAEAVEVRMLKALQYLQMKNPQGDWAYYLQKNGEIRWSDVIFIGHSHGATSSAAFAKLRRVWRAISLAGPRDTNPVAATWLTMPSATPIDRYYGFTGTGDSQYNDHVKSMELQKYPGTLTAVEGAQAPFGNTHRLRYNGGHGGAANCSNYAAVCKYMLGVE